MRQEFGSYLDKSYFVNPISIAPYILCGALLSYSGFGVVGNVSHCEPKNRFGYAIEKPRSNMQNNAYQVPAPTWSPSENLVQLKTNQSIHSKLDVLHSLNVIKKFSFLEVDKVVDDEIERYFASKPIKTKTILVNQRINNG